MKRTLLLGVVCAAMATQASAWTVNVSCFRGPWKSVIIDRSNPEFVQSLVALGYQYDKAERIAEQLCRDPRLVDRPDAMTDAVKQVIRTDPPTM